VEFTVAGTNTYALGGLQGSRTLAAGANSLSVGGNDASTTYSGDLSTTGSLTKTGTGTLTLSGSNSLAGGTTIDDGTLALGSSDALGSAGTISFAGGTLQFSAGNTTDYSSRFSNAPGQAYELDTNGQNVALETALTSSGGSLTKSGAGTLTMTGSHSYSGPTTVQAGTLSLSGTLSSSAVTVQAGATLTGDAFLGSSLTVSGTLSPGDNPGTVTAASLTLLDGSTTVMDVVSSGAAGTAYDTIVVTTSGSLTYDGNLRVAFSASSPFADDTTFSLFDFSGSPSGTFDTITTIGSGIYAGLTFTKNTVDGNWYSGDTLSGQFLKFSPSTGNLVVVPEPSTWVAAVVGIAFAARFARRRRV